MIEKFINNIPEIWQDIKGYEGLYQVSNYGQIKRFYKGKRSQPYKILKSQISRKHLHVNLCKNGIVKQYYVHRLVLEAFVGPCPPGMECRHLDGNASNNRLDNLKWGTKSDNRKDSIKHGTRFQPDTKGSKSGMAKLNDWKIRIIIRLLEDGYLIQQEIADIFNVSRSLISYIKNRKIWKHLLEKFNGIRNKRT